MSNTDDQLQSHETRLGNVEREVGPLARRVDEIQAAHRNMASEIVELRTGVTRAKGDAAEARRGVDALEHRMGTFEIAMSRAVDKMTAGTKSHLERQDKDLSELKDTLRPMAQAVDKLVDIEETKAKVAAADKARIAKAERFAKLFLLLCAFIAAVGVALKALVK